MLRTLLIILIATIAGNIASADSFTLSSCDHEIAKGSGYGSNSAGEIAAAAYIPATRLKSLSGNHISRIDIGLISRINVREVTVWVRKDLNGENLASGMIDRGSLGWNEVTLDTPYEIASDSPGLYIGFSYTNSGTSHPVSFVGEAGEFTSWLKTTADGEWVDMTSVGNLSIEAVVTGNTLPLYDLSLISGSLSPDPAQGEGYYLVEGKVANVATRPITGFHISVLENGNFLGGNDVSLRIEPGATVAFATSVQSATRPDSEVTVTIDSLLEGNDANTDDNSITAMITFARNVLLEEFTTEKCTNCPEAARMLHKVLNSDPMYSQRVVPVCHHSGFGTDWLTRRSDQKILFMFNDDGNTFAPSLMFNRLPIFKRGLKMDREEPIVAFRSENDVEECVAEALKIPAHAMLGINVKDRENASTAASVDVEVNIITDKDFDVENPVIVFYAIEENVQSKDQKGADSDFIHSNVIRYDNGDFGEEIDLSDGVLSKSYTVEIDSEWKRDDLHFVAFIANLNTEDANDNIVENVAKAPLMLTPSGVAPNPSAEAYEIGRYDLLGRSLAAPAKGINIVVYSNGITKKVIVN